MPNIDLLYQIADLVDREQENLKWEWEEEHKGPSYDQTTWGKFEWVPLTEEQAASQDWDELPKPLCGTTACIAGWAALLSDYTKPRIQFFSTWDGLSPNSRREVPYITGYIWGKLPPADEVERWALRHMTPVNLSKIQDIFYTVNRHGHLGEDFKIDIDAMALVILDLGPEFLAMFDGGWVPPKGMTVGAALRAVAKGAPFDMVTTTSTDRDQDRRLIDEIVAQRLAAQAED